MSSRTSGVRTNDAKRRLGVINHLARFVRMPWRRKCLYVAVAIELYRARIEVSYIPFRRVARHLGTIRHDSPNVSGIDPGGLKTVRELSRVIAISSRILPGKLVCLPQAIAAQRILRRSGLDTTLYLGVRAAERVPLEAHAWLECAGYVVTGAHVYRRFTPLAAFHTGTNGE